MTIIAPRGTFDIYSEEMLRWQCLEREIRRIMNLFSYNEIRTPIFESTELFMRGIGEETDIVTKEMYTFNDKGGRSNTLRPEGTASVVRSYVERKMSSENRITKLYYIAPMFRYERPQAGRYRQHHQFGVEAIGSESADVDVEVIALIMQLYQGIGLKNLELRLNSVGCPECRPTYINELKGFLRGVEDQLCTDCKIRASKNPLRVLDCKNEKCGQILEKSPVITQYLCEGCEKHFENTKNGLGRLSISYILDSRLVRGLDYYTKTTFEVRAVGIGAQDSIAGGGRYDTLIEMLGGPPTPAVGFGAGIERLLATLDKYGIELPIKEDPLIFFALLGEKARENGLPLLYECRKRGVRCETDYFDRGLKAQLKAANRLKATCVVMIGEEETASGKAMIRDFTTKEQTQVAFSELADYIMKKLKEVCADD